MMFAMNRARPACVWTLGVAVGPRPALMIVSAALAVWLAAAAVRASAASAVRASA